MNNKTYNLIMMKNNNIETVKTAIEQTQDGKNLQNDSDWNVFINSRIEYNTSGDLVDTENLQSDIEYMIRELSKIKDLLEAHNEPFDFNKEFTEISVEDFNNLFDIQLTTDMSYPDAMDYIMDNKINSWYDSMDAEDVLTDIKESKDVLKGNYVLHLYHITELGIYIATY